MPNRLVLSTLAVAACCVALILGCKKSGNTTTTETRPTGARVKVAAVAVPRVDLDKMTQIIDNRKKTIGKALDDPSSPNNKAAKEYVARADEASKQLRQLDTKLSPLATAIAAGDFAAAQKLATPELIKDVEVAKANVEKLEEAPPADSSPTPTEQEKEEKSFWKKTLEVLEVILRILSFIIEIFGSGEPGPTTDTGTGSGTGPGSNAGIATDAGSIEVASGGSPGVVASKATLLSDGGKEHLARLDGQGDANSLVVAIDKDPQKTVRLPLPKNVSGAQVIVSNLKATPQSLFPVSATVSGKEGMVDLRWDADSRSPVIVTGKP